MSKKIEIPFFDMLIKVILCFLKLYVNYCNSAQNAGG